MGRKPTKKILPEIPSQEEKEIFCKLYSEEILSEHPELSQVFHIISQNPLAESESKRFTLWEKQENGYLKISQSNNPLELYPLIWDNNKYDAFEKTREI